MELDWSFNPPLEGMAEKDELLEPDERQWVIPTRNFGPRHQGNPNADPWTYHRTDPTGGVFTKLPGEQPSGQRELFSSTRSLYHGTLLDHLPSIQQHGLIPEVGPFVSDVYGLNEPFNFLAFSPEEIGVEPVAFMTDKKRLEKALNAIRFNVSQKLNKRWSDVTPNDVRNHGLLLKSKGEMGQQDPPMNYVWDERHEEPFEEGPRAHQPRGVAGEGPYQAEPGDYYSREPVGGLEYIHGPAMMRVFERQGLIPWWDPMDAALEDRLQTQASWRFAMPFYHVTDEANREKIEREGLLPNWDPEVDEEPGVFMSEVDTPEELFDPKGGKRSGDIWHINTEGLQPQEDPWGNHYTEEERQQYFPVWQQKSWYVNHPVEPERLERVEMPAERPASGISNR